MAPEEYYPPPSPLKKAATYAIILLFILVVLSILFVLVTPFFGWRTEIVLSGSMEPAIQTGSIVVARPVAPGEIHEGDVIMFASLAGHSLTTHRVIKVEERSDGFRFSTKGDANKNADITPVVPSQLVGMIVLTVPYLGYLISFIKTPLGLILCLGVPLAILIISELLNILRSQN